MTMDIQNPAIPGLVWAYRFRPGNAPCTRLPPDAQWSDMETSDATVFHLGSASDAREEGLAQHLLLECRGWG